MDQIRERDTRNSTTGEILQCAFRVSNELGCGFLEKVYEDESQVMNHLRGKGLAVALLLNFGRPRVQYRRIVWSF